METVKKSAKTMEAVSLLSSEMILHTNEIFSGLMKYITTNPQKTPVVNDALINITSLWTALGILYTTSSNIEYDRKSIGMIGLLPEKQQDFNYLVKKAKNIENEFFKFSSALKTVIQSLRYFAKYSNSDKKYDETIGILSKIDSNINNVVADQIRDEISSFVRKYSKKGSGDCVVCTDDNDEMDVKTATFGGNQYVVVGNIAAREQSRKTAFQQLLADPREEYIQQYMRNFYCIIDKKKFIELSKDNVDKKLSQIALAAGLTINALFTEDILQRMFSYIVRHIEKLQMLVKINLGIEIIEFGSISTIVVKIEHNDSTVKYKGILQALSGLFTLLRNIDLQFLTAPTVPAVADDSDKARTKVFKRINELFTILQDDYSKKYFIHGGGDSSDNSDIIAAIREMDEYETNNVDKLLELENKFTEKIAYADELNSCLQRIMSPDKSTCVKKLIQYTQQGIQPENLL